MAKLSFLLAVSLLILAAANQVLAEFDCSLFSKPEAALDGGLQMVKDYVSKITESNDQVTFDQECINQAVKRNYLEATEVMIAEYFSKDPQRASQAESTARNAIDQVRNRQNDFLARFERIPKSIPVISPAFQWAQSLNQTLLEVKYSTRFDSPACLDIFDQEFRIENEGTRLFHSAMCRNDKKLLRYELKLDLFGKVMDQPDSTLEESSVGRVFVNLAKDESPSRWKRLLKDNNTKPNNMNIWWDIYEKHQKDLDGHAPEDEDDDNNNSEENEENDDDATIVKSKKPKGGKKGGKKKERKTKKEPATAAVEQEEL